MGAVGEVPLLRSSINELETINPGLAPWAMQEYRPVGAHPCLCNVYPQMGLRLLGG